MSGEGGGGVLRELLAVFGIKVDGAELKDADKHVDAFAEKLEHLEGKLQKAGKAIAEAFGAEKLREFIKENLEVSSHLKDLSNRLDVGAQDIRAFGFVAKDAGVDLDSAANALGLLEKKLGEAATKGGESAAAFAKLGIETKGAGGQARPLTEILGDVADSLEKLPDQNQRAAAAMELFGRQGRALVPIFAEGREAFEEAMKEAEALGNGLGEGFYAQVKRAADGFEHTEHAVQSLKDRALAAILPAVTAFGHVLERAAIWLIELDKRTHALQAAFVTLTIVVGVALVDALFAAGTALATFLAPILVTFGPAIALVGGLVWGIQDLWNAMTGAKSVLADLVEQLGGLDARNKFVKDLRELWAAIRRGIDDVAYATGYLLGVMSGVGEAITGIDTGDDVFLALADDVGSFARALEGLLHVLESVGSILKAGVLDQLRPYLAALHGAHELAGAIGNVASSAVQYVSADVTEHGVPVAAASEDYGRQPLSFARDTKGNRGTGGARLPKEFTRGPSLVAVPSVRQPTAFSRGGGAAGGDRIVQQHNENHVVVHAASNQPQAIGDATGAGIATATQKDLNAALAVVVKP